MTGEVRALAERIHADSWRCEHGGSPEGCTGACDALARAELRTHRLTPARLQQWHDEAVCVQQVQRNEELLRQATRVIALIGMVDQLTEPS